MRSMVTSTTTNTNIRMITSMRATGTTSMRSMETSMTMTTNTRSMATSMATSMIMTTSMRSMVTSTTTNTSMRSTGTTSMTTNTSMRSTGSPVQVQTCQVGVGFLRLAIPLVQINPRLYSSECVSNSNARARSLDPHPRCGPSSRGHCFN